jgi:diguanylate cyclase (GGDEF)-like protein
MTALIGGLVFPQSILSSAWFSVLATVVAFNTLVYIGLTLSKLAPLPKPARAGSVRRWLGRFGITVDEEAAMKDLPETTWTNSEDPYELMRTTIARRYIPTGLIVLGGLTTVLSLVTLATGTSEDQVVVHLTGVILGLAILISSQVVIRSRINVPTLRWVWCASVVLVASALIINSAFAGNQTSITYVLLLLVAFPPIAMAWTPSIVGNAIIFGGVVIAAFTVAGDEDIQIVTVGLVAALVGAGLLRLRLLVVDSLADETIAANALATTDLATGMLTRNGLQTLMPSLAGIAVRMESSVCVIYLKIDDLKDANRQYGIDYGNSILKVVAEAIAARVRSGDLVARYSGGDFLVAGLGDKPSALALADRIEAAIDESGHSLGRTPIRVHVGTAAGSPTSETFEELVRTAQRESGDSRSVAS